jgi:CheY-like chemotaxis protein
MTARGNSRRVILCVDDQRDGLGLRQQVLERAGYKTLATTSARKALELFRMHHIDLVLTEHMAPAMLAGHTLAAIMKRLKPEVPVAILSADMAASPEDMRFADRFITKLAPVEELLCSIEELLFGRELLAEAA